MEEQEKKSWLVKPFDRIKKAISDFKKNYEGKEAAKKSKIPGEMGHDEFYESYSKFSEGSPLND